VFIDDQPLQDKFGTFPSIKEGSTLRTGQGRAEILLTPGVFLRLDQNSAIRMVGVALTDTRVEFQKGSAILDSTGAQPGNSPVLLYWGSEVRFPKPGVYRFDSEPAPILEVYSGQAEVKHDGQLSAIDTSSQFFFLAGAETSKYGDGNFDAFYDWAKDRSDAIVADNRAAAQSAADPGDMDNGLNLPVDPGLGSSIPIYGGSGGSVYGSSTIGSPFGYGPAYPYSPYSPFGGYGLDPFAYPYNVFVVVPRFPYSRVHSRWPDRPRSPHWTSGSAGIPPTRARISPTRISPTGVPPIRTGIPGYQPYRLPAYTPRAVPRPYTPPRPTVSRPLGGGMPRGGIRGGFAAHPIGRR